MLYEIWAATPDIPNFKVFESPTGASVLENWTHMVESDRKPGSRSVLQVVKDGKTTLLAEKNW